MAGRFEKGLPSLSKCGMGEFVSKSKTSPPHQLGIRSLSLAAVSGEKGQ